MLEQVFVGTGILAWLSVLKNDADGALASLAAFHDRAEEEAPNLTSNIDAFICRIKLYQGEDVSDWMKQVPDENAEFCTMERLEPMLLLPVLRCRNRIQKVRIPL